MATKGARIDIMFLLPPYPAAGSATENQGRPMVNDSKSVVSKRSRIHHVSISLSYLLCFIEQYTKWNITVFIMDILAVYRKHSRPVNSQKHLLCVARFSEALTSQTTRNQGWSPCNILICTIFHHLNMGKCKHIHYFMQPGLRSTCFVVYYSTPRAYKNRTRLMCIG